MNILLINFPKHNFEAIFPFSLGYISSMLKAKGHNVFGVDLFVRSEEDIFSILQEESIDVIGLDISSYLNDCAISLCAKTRETFSGKIVVLGDYATLVGCKLFESLPAVDYILRGDPEFVFCEICDDLEGEKGFSQGVYSQGRVDIKENGFAIIKDLDELPFPDRNIFPMKDYSEGMLTKKELYMQMLTSRGCDYGCNYCAEGTATSSYRFRSPQNVVDEMVFLSETFDVVEFHMEDKNFIGNNVERVKNICSLILEKLDPVLWQCPGVIPLREFSDVSVLDEMGKAGCYNISFGVESFSDSLLRNNGREQEADLIPAIIERCRRNGIELSCNMILGLPGQTKEGIASDVRKARKYPFDFVHYNVYTPLLIGNSSREGGYLNSCKKSQMLGNLHLLLKVSVICFIVRRLFFLHNWKRFFKKMIYYYFKEKKVHVA